jgi:pyruvate formate lyase activating enzyme
MDDRMHIELTGVSNRTILRNLARLLEMEKRAEVWIRYPLAPGLNDGPDNYHAMGAFLQPFARRYPLRVDILPYHQLGQSKYRKLGLEYPMGDTSPPDSGSIEEAARILVTYGLDPHTDN